MIAHDGAPPWRIFAGYESDGDLIHVRRRKDDGAIVRLIMRGGQRLSFQGRSLLNAQDLPQGSALDGATTIGGRY
jgi:hypothetical protein